MRQWHQHQLHATDACAQQPRDAPPCSDRDKRPRRMRARQRHQLHATAAPADDAAAALHEQKKVANREADTALARSISLAIREADGVNPIV